MTHLRTVSLTICFIYVIFNLGNRVIGLYEINVPDAWSIIQANNIYVYCGNNSLMLYDPFGMSAMATILPAPSKGVLIYNDEEYPIVRK